MSEQALFQSGMDLEHGSSTARTEVYAPAFVSPFDADGTPADRKDFFIHRDDKVYAGTHLIIDLWGATHLDDLELVDETLKKCVDAAGATLLHLHLHHFTPNGGISGVAVLAESHISIHTWPERDYAALDIFMCGDAKPHEAIEVLRAAFRPDRIDVGEHLRGRVR